MSNVSKDIRKRPSFLDENASDVLFSVYVFIACILMEVGLCAGGR